MFQLATDPEDVLSPLPAQRRTPATPATSHPLWNHIGVHKRLACVHHPTLRWLTKGAGRNVHFTGADLDDMDAWLADWRAHPENYNSLGECLCPMSDLRVIEVE